MIANKHWCPTCNPACPYLNTKENEYGQCTLDDPKEDCDVFYYYFGNEDEEDFDDDDSFEND